MKHVPPPTGEPVQSLDNLAMAVPPKWGDAVLRLAKATERVAAGLEALAEPADAEYVPRVRDLAKVLIDFLDGLDADPDLEPTLGYEHVPGGDECEGPEDDEPSLGSLDRMTDQSKSWAVKNWDPVTGADFEVDSEKDDSDSEPSLGSVEKIDTGSQEQWASGDRHDLEEEHDGGEPQEDDEPDDTA